MWWSFWRRKRSDADLDEEIAHDLTLETEERVHSGMSRQDAERASRKDFGERPAGKGGHAQSVGMDVDRDPGTGSSLCRPNTAAKPRLRSHLDSGAVAWDRCEYSYFHGLRRDCVSAATNQGR